MEIRRVKISELNPAAYNPRVRLTPGDEDYESLKLSIETNDLVKPIVWNESTGNIVGGHQRYYVLIDLGYEETDVSVVHIDDLQKEKQVNIALNKNEGEWDSERQRALFAELEVEDIFSTGFTEAELRSIFPEKLESVGEIFGDTEEEDGGEAPEEDDDEGEDEEPAQEFIVYLSFPSRDAAESWMEEEGIDREFTAGRNLIIRMEGDGYAD